MFPTTKAEYEHRFMQNMKYEGFGLEFITRMPCPFCAAPNFFVYTLFTMAEVWSKGSVCNDCHRGAKIETTSTGGAMHMVMFQTAGDDPPEWAPHPRRARLEDPKSMGHSGKSGENAGPVKAPPVDRSKRTLTDGSPVTEDHREIQSDGMQKGYVVLSAEERSKGFVKPVRRTYLHKPCNTTTTMGLALAETYARDPKFYVGTYCVHCRSHFPLAEFVWEGTAETLGT